MKAAHCGGRRFHGEGVGGHVGDLLLDQLELAERLLELHALLGVLDGGLQAGLGGAGAAGAEGGAAEVEHGQRDAQALADLAEDVLGGHGHVVEGQPGRGGAADAALGHARLDHLEAGHVRRDQEGGDLRLVAAGHGRAGHHGQHVGDAAVGDVALLAVEDVGLAVGRRRGGRLHVGGVGAGFRLGQGEGGQLFAADQVGGSQRLFLLLGAEQQQGADADAVVGVDEDGGRRSSGRRSPP